MSRTTDLSDCTKKHVDHDQQSLLDRAREGSAASHATLLMVQRQWMLPWFNRELPKCLRGKLDPDDATQEACFHAWRSFKQFAGVSVGEYRRWLRSVCHHCLLGVVEQYVTALRREVAREVMFDDGAMGRDGRRPCHRVPELGLGASPRVDLAGAIERLLSGLRPRARQIVILHARDDRTFCDIAQELGCSVRTVRREWHRAREELQRRRDWLNE